MDDKRRYVVQMPAPVRDLAEWHRLYDTPPEEPAADPVRAIVPDGNGKLKFEQQTPSSARPDDLPQ